MSFLNDVGNIGTNLANGLLGGASALDRQLNSLSHTPQDFEKDGFIVPPVPNGDGTGLPSSKIRSSRQGIPTRKIGHWFVPEVGVVSMYINPQQIAYTARKLINTERTKGGFVSQYWGETLATMNLRGNTGSSGVEGLNVLYEIYRAEQYLFDPIALTMASDNSVSGLNDLIDSSLGNLGGSDNLLGALGDATGGLLGLDPASQNVLPRNVPSLAALALGIEFYHEGWVHRGYFESMSYNERADNLGIWEYDIQFIVTQRRGYRVNSFGWQHTPLEGPSNSSSGGPSHSFSGLVGDNASNIVFANPITG